MLYGEIPLGLIRGEAYLQTFFGGGLFEGGAYSSVGAYSKIYGMSFVTFKCREAFYGDLNYCALVFLRRRIYVTIASIAVLTLYSSTNVTQTYVIICIEC